MKNKSLVSINDYTKDEMLRIIELAAFFENNPNQKILDGKLVANLFFEPSTRTRLSFESAILRLGGHFTGFSETKSTSVTKGETFKDTIRIIDNYCDLIVIRHHLEGSAKYASEIATVPVINAGDGSHQHPTQTLLDMFSIQKTQGSLEDLNIFFVGDLKYGRTVHSLLMAMSNFKPVFNFISPEELSMPPEYLMHLDNLGINYYEHYELNNIIKDADIIYMTRVQEERFSDPIDFERVKDVYILTNKILENTKPNLKILHPLPRVNEIHVDVDSNPKAYYFEQALNGMYTRQAIIADVMGLI